MLALFAQGVYVPGGICPRGYMSRGYMSQGVYVLGGKCLGGKCPGGIRPWGKCCGVHVQGRYVLEPSEFFMCLHLLYMTCPRYIEHHLFQANWHQIHQMITNV